MKSSHNNDTIHGSIGTKLAHEVGSFQNVGQEDQRPPVATDRSSLSDIMVIDRQSTQEEKKDKLTVLASHVPLWTPTRSKVAWDLKIYHKRQMP
jgi:hypothetical protein